MIPGINGGKTVAPNPYLRSIKKATCTDPDAKLTIGHVTSRNAAEFDRLANDPNRTRMTNLENEALIGLNIIETIASTRIDGLSERVKRIYHGPQALGSVKWGACYLLERVADTMPMEQLVKWHNSLPSLSYTTGFKRPGGQRRDNDYGVWVSWAEMNVFFEAMHDHCLMCECDAQQERSCKLRKTLDNFPHDCPAAPGGDPRRCPYKGIL